MTPTTIRRSLELTPDQWAALEDLAAQVNAVSRRGPTPGQPSWRILIAMLADGELRLDLR